MDLHNHLLPGLDDGAPDMESAIAMARMARDDGITHMVCTPHIHPGRYDNSAREIQQSCEGFTRALAAHGIDLQVAAAAEVRIGPELLEGLAQGSVPLLGRWEGKAVLLLELPHSGIPLGSARLTEWLIVHGVIPLLAHPERNAAVMAAPGKLRPFLEQGCLLQITAGSLTGHFGRRAQAVALALLGEGKVTLLASDAHTPHHRPPLLSAGVARAAEVVGEAAARRLVEANPAAIAQAAFE